MKKSNIKLFSLLFAAFTMTATMVSCGNDDNKSNPETNTGGTGEDISNYKTHRTLPAWSTISFSYIDEPMYDSGIKLETKYGYNKVNGTTISEYDSLFFFSSVWGTGKFDMLKHTGVMLVAGHGKEAKPYDASVTGSIDEGKVVITIPGMMGGTTINLMPGDAPFGLVISKTYTVNTYSEFSVAGRDFPKYQPTANEKVVITPSVKDNYAKANIAFTSTAQTSWGVFDFQSVEVTEADDIYTITGEGKCTMANPRDPSATPNVYTATIEGTITGDKLVGTIKVPEVHGVTIYLNPDDFDTVINSGK